jgi:RNA polymerase sigma-70 factor, ECF subfamily
VSGPDATTGAQAKTEPEALRPAFRRELLESVPALRAFARSLVGEPDQADDLVQEAVTRALTHAGSFTPGTNMKAWLFTILRNQFISEIRRRTREATDSNEAAMAVIGRPAGQEVGLHVRDFRRAFDELPVEQREALMLIGAEGFSYDEAAGIAGCAVGTMKSRVSRARRALSQRLSPDSEVA